MLFVLWFKFDPDHTNRVRELWKHFKYPKEVKVIGRYVLIGRHMSVAIFDAPDEETLLKITGPFEHLRRSPHRTCNANRRSDSGNVVRERSTSAYPIYRLKDEWREGSIGMSHRII